jgi:hypothetical protein
MDPVIWIMDTVVWILVVAFLCGWIRSSQIRGFWPIRDFFPFARLAHKVLFTGCYSSRKIRWLPGLDERRCL